MTQTSLVLATALLVFGAAWGCKRDVAKKPAAITSASGSALASLDAQFPGVTPQPPASASRGAMGVRWVVFTPGSGPSPGPADQILAALRVSRPDGTAGSDRAGAQTLSFGAYSLPEPLRDSVGVLREGARARYWLPKATLSGWKPADWVEDDLVVDLEVKKIAVAKPVVTAMSAKAPEQLVPKPDVTPPAGAKTSRSGHRYLRLIAGNGGVQPRADARVRIRFSAWQVDGLVVTPLALDQAATLQLSQAPAAVTEFLPNMVEGDVVRAWLPGSAAKGLVAEDVRAFIVDLGLASIE